MEHISSFDAKTHLSKLLAHVVEGQEYVITRHNKEIAILSPYPNDRKNIAAAIEAIKKLRSRQKIRTKSIAVFRDEGHR